ncbi:uncharacterized protein LOC132194989 [Neocloeon triangulifer]|uniref:uncharacterized protein LOC132194989 n=1 Tax=Neocloeon triangulifer TaxID=2078957 RepID=UPI00286F8B99|nr:uncharacterized protein LOC132194989 [Neocloeon triangulifer]
MESREDVGQIVPWFSSDEWRIAAKLIAGEDADHSKALSLMRLWKARCDTLPVGVETSMVLLCALERASENSAILDDLGQRLALSAALTRFLNHALTASKDSFNQSMFEKAKSADIPGWIVKLRHEAAHGKSVPALEPLLKAANFALDWLRWHYWNEEPLDWSPSVPQIAEIVDEWEALCACQHVGYKKISSLPDENLRLANAGVRSVAEAAKNAEQQILDATVASPENLLSAILSSQTFLTPPPGLYGKEELPELLIAQWRPLLGALHAARFLPQLILKLHEKNSRLAALWNLYLLERVQKLRAAQKKLYLSGVVVKETSSLARFLQKKREEHPELQVETDARQAVGLELEWPLFVAAPSIEELKSLTTSVAANPNKNARIYIERLLSFAETEATTRDKILQIWSIYFGEQPSPAEVQGDIQTLDDLVEKAPQLEQGCRWIRLDEWNAEAIGRLPWQQGFVNLELNFDSWE